MTGLPLGWKADYDGRRWYYTYRPTGLVQYSFPNEGDEFPHFVDASAPAPDLAPEERLESEQQVRRQFEAVPTGMSPPNPWKLDANPAPELRVEVSPPPPPPAFDPVGIVAEMPTQDTPASRSEMGPEPVELADNSVLAPIEKEATPGHRPGLHHSSVELPSSELPSYQPYTPDPHGTYLRPDKRTVPSVIQRDVSLMMSLKLPGHLEPSAVPRVLSPPQMPPKVPLQQEAPAQEVPAAPVPAGSNGMKMALKQLARSTAAADPQSTHPHARTQSQGALAKFPSVLKPARGRISATPAQLQSLSAQKKRSSAPSTASWKTTWEATPPPRATALPAYVPYQKGPDDQPAPQTQKASRAEEPSRPAGDAEADSSLRKSPPTTPPPPPPQALGSGQYLASSPPSVRSVSPIRSASASFCSRIPARTPSPVESSLRTPSNASLRQGAHGPAFQSASSSALHLSDSAPQLATQNLLQGTRGPVVPDKTPLEPNEEATLPIQTPALARGGRTRVQSDASSLSVPPRYSPDDYPEGFQVSSGKRRTASPSSQTGALGAQQPSHADASASAPNYKLGRIDEDGERGAAAEPKIVPQSKVPVSVASSTQQSTRISSLQAQTFSVSAGAAAKEDASQRTPRQSCSPARERPSKLTKARPSPGGAESLRGTPSIRLVQSREAAQAAAGSFCQPLKSHPIGKPPVFMVESLQEFPASSDRKQAGSDKEKKWTKWFKSSRLSRSQKEQAHCGQMLGAEGMNPLPTRAADGQIV